MKWLFVLLMLLIFIGCSRDKSPISPDPEWKELKYELNSRYGAWFSARIVDNTDGLVDVKWADSLGVFHEPFRFGVHADTLFYVDLWEWDWIRMEAIYGKYEK